MVNLAKVTVKKTPPNYEKGKNNLFCLALLILFRFDNNFAYKRKKKDNKEQEDICVLFVSLLLTTYAYYGSSQKKYFWEMV